MTLILIFDYDGVIVDSLEIFMNSFLHACRMEGWAQIDSKTKFLRLFDGNMFENMIEMGMTVDEIKAIVYRVRNYLIRNQQKMKMFEGMKESLSYLSENHPLFIITSNESTVVEKFLQFNDSNFFKEIYGSDKEPSKVVKINTIKEKYPADNYVYIGDTIGDIIEGKKAKVITVAVTWGWHDPEKLTKIHPDFLIHAPGDIKLLPEQIKESYE
jgi:phosphoglycolate phosphatase